MTVRPPQANDQGNAEKARNLLLELIELNSHVEDGFWIAAMWQLIVEAFKNSNLNYNQFCKEMDSIKNHYRDFFEKSHEK